MEERTYDKRLIVSNAKTKEQLFVILLKTDNGYVSRYTMYYAAKYYGGYGKAQQIINRDQALDVYTKAYSQRVNGDENYKPIRSCKGISKEIIDEYSAGVYDEDLRPDIFDILSNSFFYSDKLTQKKRSKLWITNGIDINELDFQAAMHGDFSIREQIRWIASRKYLSMHLLGGMEIKDE